MEVCRGWKDSRASGQGTQRENVAVHYTQGEVDYLAKWLGSREEGAASSFLLQRGLFADQVPDEPST